MTKKLTLNMDTLRVLTPLYVADVNGALALIDPTNESAGECNPSRTSCKVSSCVIYTNWRNCTVG